MKRAILFLFGFLLAVAGYLAVAVFLFKVPPSPPLPAGAALVAPSVLLEPAAFLSAGRGAAVVRKVLNSRLPFTRAVRVSSYSRPPQSYDIQLRAPTTGPVKAGDLLVARFFLRKPLFPRTKARVDFVFEQAGGDYKKSIVLPLEPGPRWRRVDVPFRSAGDYPAGGAQAAFRAGFGPQAVDIGGFELVNYGRAPGRVPLTAFGLYEGREAGAPWRAEAEQRIEKFRKASIAVTVLNPDGTPAPGAAVEIKQLKHAFSFGCAVNSKVLFDKGPEGDKRRYKETFLKLFNSATIENGLKWPFWEGDQKRWADRTAAWLAANGVKLRGHTLIWPGWEHLPVSAGKLRKNQEKLRAAVRRHITEEASYYRGKAADWDVLNEPVGHPEVLALLGQGEAAEWFRLARAADPSARLFVNDYGVLDDFGANSGQQDGYEAFIRSLLDEKAPLDGIGLQSHFKWDLTPPARLLTVLDRFQGLGKPLLATEFDIDITDEELQADYLRDFMTALFSHPAVEGITLWGFWEGVHSEPAPALYRKDWSKKPAAEVLEELLLKKWRTAAGGAADKRGKFGARGFLGSYEVRVSFANGATAAAAFVLPKEGASVTVKPGK